MGERKLTEKAHEVVRAVVRPGDVVIDATVGNGHDTCFLVNLVGPAGTVFGFDVQPAALTSAADRLAGRPNVAPVQADHARMRELVPAELQGRVAPVMFNLGYLPGGDHGLTTTAATTLPALAAALDLLKPGGVLTVVAYRGHPGGREEAAAVSEWLGDMSIGHVSLTAEDTVGHSGPVLFVIRRTRLSEARP
jgi:predicted methyltransferase